MRQAQLPPEVVLLLFLPVLLYWESLTTSLRGIVLLSTVLVTARTWSPLGEHTITGRPPGQLNPPAFRDVGDHDDLADRLAAYQTRRLADRQAAATARHSRHTG